MTAKLAQVSVAHLRPLHAPNTRADGAASRTGWLAAFAGQHARQSTCPTSCAPPPDCLCLSQPTQRAPRRRGASTPTARCARQSAENTTRQPPLLLLLAPSPRQRRRRCRRAAWSSSVPGARCRHRSAPHTCAASRLTRFRTCSRRVQRSGLVRPQRACHLHAQGATAWRAGRNKSRRPG